MIRRAIQIDPQRIDSVEPHEPRDARIRVLVIDDDADILEMIEDTLDTSRFTVRTANASERFYAELADFDPHYIITDLAMPSHDGMDVLRTLRDRSFSGAIVVASGKDGHVLDTVRRVAASYQLNVAGVLRKPFTPRQLVAQLASNGKARPAPDAPQVPQAPERALQHYFQPKVDIKSGKIVGADVVTIRPDAASNRPIARSFIHDFTNLERATAFGARLHGMGRALKIAVSFPAEVILSNEFIDVVTDAQRRHGIAPEELIVGLTEDGTMEKSSDLAERLVKLRLLGIELAINDFGAGHSSLSRLQNLPISEVNIDESFIRGLDGYSNNLAIVRSIVDLGHSLGCAVVAKGVDTAECLDVLKTIGCDMAQGLLFSPPVNEAAFVALVRDNPFKPD